jgi:alpha-N-arabinofuranosidase
MMLSLDEYACSYRPTNGTHLGLGGRQPAMGFLGLDPQRKYVRHDPDDWSTRRSFPKAGEMPRTLATASVALTMLRHADRIAIGCATSGLSLLCATDREHVWKSAAYYPYTQLINYAKGVSLAPVMECETFNVEGYAIDDMNQYGDFTGVPYVQAAAALDEEAGSLSVFVVNADWEESHAFTLDVAAFEGWKFVEHTALYSEDPEAYNDYEHPDTLVPVAEGETACTAGRVLAELKPLSWNLFRFVKEDE